MPKLLIIRVLLSSAILIALFVQVQVEEVFKYVIELQLEIFFLAICLNFFGNCFCVLRWIGLQKNKITGGAYLQFFQVYFEGITANTVLPGGILGGDLIRTVRISKYLSVKNYKDVSIRSIGLSVILERIHGLWALSFIGLVAAVTYLTINGRESGAFFYDGLLKYYLIFMVIFTLLALMTFMKKFVHWVTLKTFQPTNKTLSKIIFYLKKFRSRDVLLYSFVSQLLFGLSFFFCYKALDVNITLNMCLFLVPGIFIFAAIPFSIAGFGTREAGSLFFLVYLNLPFEQIVAGSIVFGLTATIQGLFFVVLNLVMFKKQG